jgi:hypothetical protein
MTGVFTIDKISKKAVSLYEYTQIMLGPSGFFLPDAPGSIHTDSQSLELIHSSESGFNELYRGSKNGRFFIYKALKKEYCGNPLYEELLKKEFNIGFSLNHTGICQYFGFIDFPSIGHCIVMEWIDGNIGSQLNMKYPACVLEGDNSKGVCISVAVASKGQVQDAGARMIHKGKNTSSSIISKSIVRNGGEANYRGTVRIEKDAINSKAHIECDTLILDNISRSDTIPKNEVKNNSSFLEHEATVSKISEEQLFYLMSRGINEKDATQMILMGFIEPFSRELPMEYAVELNQLIKLDMEGSVG